MTIPVELKDGTGGKQKVLVTTHHALCVASIEPDVPKFGTPNRYRFLSQLVSSVGDGTGVTNMNIASSDTGTDGACADHAGPTYTFTAASGTFDNIQQIEITDTGAGGNGVLGIYEVDSVTNSTTIELTLDPTNGTDETGLDWEVPPAVFTIKASEEYDIRIMKILIYIVDGTVTHDTFGALAALSNGVDISIIEFGTETFLVKAAKDFSDLIQQTLAERPFGDAAVSFELRDVNTSNDDAQILPMDIGSLVPGGLRIGRGTKDTLQVEVNDDLSALTTFTVRAVGYRHFP